MELLALHRISICHPEEEEGGCQHPVWKTGKQSLGTTCFDCLFKSLLKIRKLWKWAFIFLAVVCSTCIGRKESKLVCFFFFRR